MKFFGMGASSSLSLDEIRQVIDPFQSRISLDKKGGTIGVDPMVWRANVAARQEAAKTPWWGWAALAAGAWYLLKR